MRRLTTLILLLALLAAVIATPTSAATESDVAGEDDASVTPVEWNARALQYAQAQPANLEQAVKLFHRAFTRERRTLRRMRRRLRELLEREDREWQDRLEARIADGEEVDEDDNEEEEVESPGARALRDQIRLSKARMAEYLNNEGVALMRQSKLHGSRRVLTHALKLQPDHRDATNNLAELERLVAGGTRAIDGDEEPPRHQRKSAAAERRAEKRRRYESGEDDHESPKKKKAEEEEEEEEEPKPKKKKAKSSKKKAKKQPKEEAVDDTDAVYTRPAKRIPQREPEPAANMHEPRKKRPTALDRKRRPNTNPRMKLPRVHIKHLHFEENVEYANGRLPFILIGALDDWDFAAHWSIPSFAKLYSSANVDFYPHNMEKSTVRPYMTPLPKALQEQANPTHAYPVSDTHPGSYIQWNVNWRDWSAMSRNMGAAGLPSIFRQDDPWLTATSDECFNSHELQDEFTLKTHWRMVLIGNRGAGMFNHQDVLRTSSYQAQVAGSKRWHLCAPSESQYIGRAGGVDAFDPDYATYPLFAKARCYDDIVETGEMIFYPADYWHQTENIETPTISVTATVMDANNVQLIIDELDQECRVQKFKWGFTPQLCHALQQKCFAFWRKLYQLPTRRDEL